MINTKNPRDYKTKGIILNPRDEYYKPKVNIINPKINMVDHG